MPDKRGRLNRYKHSCGWVPLSLSGHGLPQCVYVVHLHLLPDQCPVVLLASSRATIKKPVFYPMCFTYSGGLYTRASVHV
jgi:hypothetical protein